MTAGFVSRAVLDNMECGVAILTAISADNIQNAINVASLLGNAVLTATSPSISPEFRPLLAGLTVRR